MKTMLRLLLVTGTLVIIAACSPGPQSGRGFALPEGDPETGRQAFVDLQCHACHTIDGVELPEIGIAAPVSVRLGGATTRVKTYGDLVTSIINPSHKLIGSYPEAEVAAGRPVIHAEHERVHDGAAARRHRCLFTGAL